MMNIPKKIAQQYDETGKKKTEIPLMKLLVFSILAGSFVALASVSANTAVSMIENPGVAKIVGALIFPCGLIMIIVAGAELFTGDCLMVIAALDKEIKWRHMFRCWFFVYIGNFVGSAAVAWLVYRGGQFSLFAGNLAVTTMKTAAAKCAISFESALILGILCNFLVCIAVWMNFAGKNVWDKIAGAYVPVFLFVLAGFEHCVANMYFIPAGLFAKGNAEYASLAAESGVELAGLTWGNFLFKNLLPVTIGNIFGGAVLVGTVYWYLYLYKGKRRVEEQDK